MTHPRPRPDFSGLKTAATLSAVGLSMALSVGIGAGIGVWADRKLGTRGWVIAGTLLGIVAAFKQLFQAAREAEREERRLEQKERRQKASPGEGHEE